MKLSRWHGVGVAFAGSALVAACGGQEAGSWSEEPSVGEGASGSASSSSVPSNALDTEEDAVARDLLVELRDRHPALFSFLPPPAAAVSSQSVASAVSSGVWSALSARPGTSRLPTYERELGRWLPYFGGDVDVALDMILPESADGAVELRDRTSEVAVSLRLEGAGDALGGQADGLLIYPDGGGAQTALVYRAVASGFEDYVAFDVRPARPEVRYQVALSVAVAGLRLVEGTLEFLDARGTPRLRAAAPYVVGADGRRVDARLEVEGCKVDESPALPWGRAPVAPGAGACGLWVSWDDTGVVYPAVLDPVWSSAGSLSTARERFASALLSDGRVLVAGGLSGSAAPLDSAEVYDPETRTWSVTGSLAAARSAHTLSLRGSGFALAVGGQGALGSLASTESYDPLLGTWSEGPALPSALAGHSAVTLPNGELFVAGGLQSVSAFRLGDAASSWSSAGEQLAEEDGSTLTLLSDGRVLLVGPRAPTAQLWDAESDAWSETGAPAFNRSGHSATLLPSGEVLVVGGAPGLLAAELYRPSTGAWARTGATTEPHTNHSASLLPGGRVVVVGGVERTGLSLSDGSATEIYNPTWGTWAPGPLIDEDRSAHEAVVLSGGRLLVVGGVAGDPPGAGVAEVPNVPAAAADGGAAPLNAAPGTVLASAEDLALELSPTTITEYKLPAQRDRDVVSSTFTELWAAVTRPTVLEEGRRYPLLLFLHGNHATCGTGSNPRSDVDCSYTDTGICPDGFVVVPSHRGYDYTTTELAARGYIVVSVNANRGITCGGSDPEDFSMNLARGRLLLKHLQRLSEWNRGISATPASVGVSLQGKLDFSQVGLMGHSRGGEGARAAYQQFRDPGSPWPARIVEPLSIRGIFEIGPVDGQTPRIFNADGTAWNVLLPMCDGDVSDLQGVHPFDRMLAMFSEPRDSIKSSYTAWGTNHNYFNSEWQESDSPGCDGHEALFESGPGITGSAAQRQIGLRSMLNFFLANVGSDANPVLNDLFDSSVPVRFDTRIDRGFTPGIGVRRGVNLENFSGPSGLSMRRIPGIVQNVSVTHQNIPEHDVGLRGARISWSTPNPERFLQLHFNRPGSGIDLSRYTSFDFRVDRAPDPENPVAPTTMLVQLVNADDSLSEPVDVAAYQVRLDGPVGGPFGNPHSMLQTARIPFADFVGVDVNAVRGVRFSFPADDSGALFLAGIRATVANDRAPFVLASLAPQAGSAPSAAARSAGQARVGRALTARQVTVAGNAVVALRAVQNNRFVELELSTQTPFKVQDDELVLDVGTTRTAQSRHPDGNLRRVIFTLPAQGFVSAANGAPLVVRYGSNDMLTWDFGALDKSKLQP